MLEMPHFSYFQTQMRKWGISSLLNIEMGHFEDNHVINFKNGKEPKMNMLDFGAFERQMQMPSHDKSLKS